jgi:[ribosomal protein S5]-alanine N-acetyltransferase
MGGMLVDRGHAVDSSRETETLTPGWVTLPSGRILDLYRSRWDGVLDREEFEFCRQHGVPLGYDCTQIGWVIETCTDESSAHPPSSVLAGAAVPVTTADPEHRTIELRGVVEAEAERILAGVRDGRMSLEAAQLRLAVAAAAAMKDFAAEHALPTCDLCHWALQSVVADALGAVRGPLHDPPPASDAMAFTFRSWTPDDAVVYMELLGNPRVWDYLPEPFPTPFTLDTARSLLDVASIGFHHETVAVEFDGRPVGQCLLRFDQTFADTRASEVAYWLGEQYWGRGWMSRILPAFTHRSFRRHPVDVIYAWIMKDNEPSIRAAERAGYQRSPFPLESRLAESLRRPGFIRYATYRADWAVDANDAS